LAENQSPLEILQANFTLDTMDDPVGIMKGNLNVVWSSYKVYPFEAVTCYEFGLQQLVKTNAEDGIGKTDSFTLTAFVDSQGKPHYYISRFMSYDESGNSPEYFNLGDFTGMNYLYGMDGKLSLMQFVKNGVAQSTVVDISESIEGLPTIPEQCMQKAPMNSATCTDSLNCALEFDRNGGSGGGGCGGSGGGFGGYILQTTNYFITQIGI